MSEYEDEFGEVAHQNLFVNNILALARFSSR